MVSVMSVSCYVTSASDYQSRSWMYIRGLIQGISRKLAEAVPIGEILYESLDTKCKGVNFTYIGVVKMAYTYVSSSVSNKKVLCISSK